MTIYVTVRMQTQPNAQSTHDSQIMTAENIAAFRAAGNTSHQVMHDPETGTYQALDTWEVDDKQTVLDFYQNEDFAAFASKVVAAPPEVMIWDDTDWIHFG